MSVLSNVGYFLIDTLFTLFIVLFMIRLLLGVARADFYNPLSQFIVTATNPILRPLRNFLPPIGRIDTASIVVMLILTVIQYGLLLSLRGQSLNIITLLPYAAIKLLEMAIYVYLFAIIIQAVISWINPTAQNGQNPMVSLLSSLTRPILEPLRGIVPSIGMFDLTALVAILGLNVLLIIIQSFI